MLVKDAWEGESAGVVTILEAAPPLPEVEEAEVEEVLQGGDFDLGRLQQQALQPEQVQEQLQQLELELEVQQEEQVCAVCAARPPAWCHWRCVAAVAHRDLLARARRRRCSRP